MTLKMASMAAFLCEEFATFVTEGYFTTSNRRNNEILPTETVLLLV
jgi:hypothetical protein